MDSDSTRSSLLTAVESLRHSSSHAAVASILSDYPIDYELRELVAMFLFGLSRHHSYPEAVSLSNNFARFLERWSGRITVGRMTLKSTRRVLETIRSSVRSFATLRTARFCLAHSARAHSFARSLTRSLRSSWESGFCLRNERVSISYHLNPLHSGLKLYEIDASIFRRQKPPFP